MILHSIVPNLSVAAASFKLSSVFNSSASPATSRTNVQRLSISSIKHRFVYTLAVSAKVDSELDSFPYCTLPLSMLPPYSPILHAVCITAVILASHAICTSFHSSTKHVHGNSDIDFLACTLLSLVTTYQSEAHPAHQPTKSEGAKSAEGGVAA